MIKKKKKNLPIRKKIIALAVLFGMVLVISLRMYQGFYVDLLMKDLHQLEQEKKQLLSETNKLKAEVYRLKNVDRIYKIAGEKFGLVVNNDPAHIIKIAQYDEFETVKKNFAERNKEKLKLNVAGVH